MRRPRPPLAIGQRVRVRHGAFSGFRGVVAGFPEYSDAPGTGQQRIALVRSENGEAHRVAVVNLEQLGEASC